jgi:hypothetical protein
VAEVSSREMQEQGIAGAAPRATEGGDRMNTLEVTVTKLSEQRGMPDAERTTWEHIVIESPGREQRFICRGIWAGDMYFYVDTSGLTYERKPFGALEIFEQLTTGDHWTMCAGYELNRISGECCTGKARP